MLAGGRVGAAAPQLPVPFCGEEVQKRPCTSARALCGVAAPHPLSESRRSARQSSRRTLGVLRPTRAFTLLRFHRPFSQTYLFFFLLTEHPNY